MKSITLKEITNQLSDPDFSHAYLVSDEFDGAGKSEAISHHILDEDTLEFHFEDFEMVIFKKDSMNAKTDGSSIFMVDVDGCNYEIRMFKTVQMTF